MQQLRFLVRNLYIRKWIVCIKDFSELSDKKRLSVLEEITTGLKNKKYGFMVANTGPLINTFGALFCDEEEQEKARMDIIDEMDSNTGIIRNIHGYPMAIINVAAIENTGFAEKFLSKIQDEKLWGSCEVCCRKAYCHIWNNHQLILENKDRVCEFIRYYYIWQSEYGTRLTIRSMTEHLAYMFTGGDGCEDIEPGKLHKKLFSNLFFGYEGIISNPLSENVVAVRLAKESGIYLKRLRADEELLIRRDYKHLFGDSLNIQCLKKVLEIEPTDYSSFRSLIICLYNKGQYDEVIEKTNMLNSKIQDKSTIYFVRAIAFAKKEKYEEALKEVKRAIELNPDNNVYQRIYGALLLAVHGSFNMNFNSSEI